MSLSKSVQTALSSLSQQDQKAFRRDYSNRSKSMLVAYLAWFLLGWHYLYFGRVGMQFAFWLTAGFLFIGWLVDFFRIPGMVSRHNGDLARELMTQYKTMAAPVAA